MHRYKKKHQQEPVVVFLDIHKAYDQCSRSSIWNKMAQGNCNSRLLNILKNLFDVVHIQVMNGNYQSKFFQPVTGVLQGNVLSPHLYSIFINALPQSNNQLLEDINCLLFADDIALISDAESMHRLLEICEEHSLLTGYRWSPSKCAVLAPKQDPPNPLLSNYKLYGTILPTTTTFKYLGVQFNTWEWILKPSSTTPKQKSVKAWQLSTKSVLAPMASLYLLLSKYTSNLSVQRSNMACVSPTSTPPTMQH